MDELDFYTKAEIDEMFDLPESEDKTLDFYTKSEIREKVGTPETIVIDENEMYIDFYVKAEIDSIPTSPIPSEYTQIAWIQATGTQYINTGYTQRTNSARIETNVHVYGGGNHAFIFGGYTVGAGVTWASVANVYFIWIYVNDTRTDTSDDGHDPYGASGDVELKIEVNPTARTITENGVIKATGAGSDPSQNAQPYCIFARSDGGHLIGAKIMTFKIYDNDVLVRDFVPVVRNADSKPGLWDMIGKQFYTNAGTGEFEIPT